MKVYEIRKVAGMYGLINYHSRELIFSHSLKSKVIKYAEERNLRCHYIK